MFFFFFASASSSLNFIWNFSWALATPFSAPASAVFAAEFSLFSPRTSLLSVFSFFLPFSLHPLIVRYYFVLKCRFSSTFLLLCPLSFLQRNMNRSRQLILFFCQSRHLLNVKRVCQLMIDAVLPHADHGLAQRFFAFLPGIHPVDCRV